MALRSMTAYGRATLIDPLGRFTVELQSINRKHLEINLHLPAELATLEVDLRKLISTRISRGLVTLRLEMDDLAATPLKLLPNVARARELKLAWDAIIESLGLNVDDGVKLQLIANDPDLIRLKHNPQDAALLKSPVFTATSRALDQLITMKQAEASAIYHDFSSRVRSLETWIDKIAHQIPAALSNYRHKLTEKLAQLLPAALDHDERILSEIALYADRIDLDEEILRFRSHLQQFKASLDASETDIGKKIEFLLQEMKREVTTMGSKSQEKGISYLVVEIKSELERIREQIQNVE